MVMCFNGALPKWCLRETEAGLFQLASASEFDMTLLIMIWKFY